MIFNYNFKTFSQSRFFTRLQGLFLCYLRLVNRQLAKHHKYSATVFGFAYPKQTTDSKILAQRTKNFAEVFC